MTEARHDALLQEDYRGQRESAQLFGFGPYALDSLDIFYFDVPPMMVLDVESGEARIASGDKELLAYLSRTMVS